MAAFFIWVEANFLEAIMKKIIVVLLFVIFLVSPVKIQAASGAISATVSAILANDLFEYARDFIVYGKQLYEAVESTIALKDQVEHWIRNEERYLKNLKSIMDVRSFNDFMGWFNRTLYISQEAERIYNGMGIKIGGKNYGLTDIDEIPDAIRNEYVDRHWDDMTEEERYKAYTSLGLAPSNYFYLKTWQNRTEDIKKRFVAAREMHADELEEAADRNNAILEEYSEEDRDEDNEIDSNKIAMNSHATQMQIEMVLRDLSLSVDDLKDYLVTRDQENKFVPNTPMPSVDWNYNPFQQISNGKTKDSYKGF
jgi:hypothetical protein